MPRPRLLATLALCALLGCEPTLPPAPPHALVPARPEPPPIGVCWVEYATNKLPGNYGIAGSSADLDWEITFSGLLVRHPKGDLLLDAGNSSRFSQEIATSGVVASILQRIYQSGGTVVASAPDALRRVGADPSRLAGIAISHAHADHAGGVLDLPGAPVILSEEELAFVRREKDRGRFDVVKAQAAAIEARARTIRFTETPYETFDRSADWFGDGSVVFVPLFGHTPGSVGTFVNRSPHERYFHVGDAVNLLEAAEKRRGKSILLGITDHDAGAADAVVANLNQLRQAAPAIRFIAAHDRKAWQKALGAPGRCVGAPRGP